MPRSQVFRRRVTVGFAVVALLAVVISAVALYTLRSVIETSNLVMSDYARDLLEARELEVAAEHTVASTRAYLITRDVQFLEKAGTARQRFKSLFEKLKDRSPRGEEKHLLDRVARAEESHQAAMTEAISAAEGSRDSNLLAEVFEETVRPRRDDLINSFAAFVRHRERQLNDALLGSRKAAGRATAFLVVIGVSSAVVAGGLFFLSARTLRRLARAEAEICELNEGLERRVEARTVELTKAVKELEGFAYTVAHDLRAPLRALAGFSQSLVEDCGGNLRGADLDHLKRIEAAGRRMDELIQGLLEYARLSYEGVTLSPTALSPTVQEVVAASTTELKAHRARIVVEEPLPWVLGQDLMLKECVENLLSNALKFVAPGVDPDVRIRSEVRGPWVRLWVEDNGVGIAPEHFDRIFGVFQRLNRPEEFTGTGIGLAIVRKAVERMGGKAGVESEPKAGSRFWIELKSAQAVRVPVAAHARSA